MVQEAVGNAEDAHERAQGLVEGLQVRHGVLEQLLQPQHLQLLQEANQLRSQLIDLRAVITARISTPFLPATLPMVRPHALLYPHDPTMHTSQRLPVFPKTFWSTHGAYC